MKQKIKKVNNAVHNKKIVSRIFITLKIIDFTIPNFQFVFDFIKTNTILLAFVILYNSIRNYFD